MRRTACVLARGEAEAEREAEPWLFIYLIMQLRLRNQGCVIKYINIHNRQIIYQIEIRVLAVVVVVGVVVGVW